MYNNTKRISGVIKTLLNELLFLVAYILRHTIDKSPFHYRGITNERDIN